jgi:patatin-related protein
MSVTKEYRFAVVMYGGVSLAVYINGVAQELLTLVRSTSLDRGVTPSRLLKVYRQVAEKLSQKENPQWKPGDELNIRFVVDIITGASAGGINGIFLAKALANNQELQKLRDLWIEQADLDLLLNDKKSVADLNGQLKNQSPPQALLNGPRLYLELLKAFRSMGDDAADTAHFADLRELDLFVTATDAWGEVLPLRLFDKIVWERRYKSMFHFRYSDPPAGTRDKRNDFVSRNDEFLAFAARCTSTFPFAFEPIKLNDLNTWLAKTGVPDSTLMEEWKELFFDHPKSPNGDSGQWVKPEERVYVDGGCLDNKPFGYVTRTLQERTANIAVERKLLYVEPSPDHPERQGSPQENGKVLAPDALENAVRALMIMPLDETIREDLENLLERNRDIGRINRLIHAIESDVLAAPYPDRKARIQELQNKWDTKSAVDSHREKAEVWAKSGFRPKNSNERPPLYSNHNDVQYSGYSRLKVATVTDNLALLICVIAGYRRSSQEYFAIRSLAKAWRDKQYNDEPGSEKTPTYFLLRFDYEYRIRRLEFLLRRIDRLRMLAASDGKLGSESESKAINDILRAISDVSPAWPYRDPGMFQEFRARLQELRDQTSSALDILRAGIHDIQTPIEKVPRQSRGHQRWNARNAVANAIQALPISADDLSHILGADDISGKPTEVDFAFDEERILENAKRVLEKPDLQRALDGLDEALNKVLWELFDRAIEEIRPGFSTNSRELTAPRAAASRIVRYYYDFFDEYDSVLYPIGYGTNIGEAALVDVIRVSPDDATSIVDESVTGKPKLAGAKLGHFGAFLDAVWRRNDILWGRLDGAERIIESTLLGVADKDEIERLIKEAHQAILWEELGNSGLAEIRKLFIQTVIQVGKIPLADQKNKMVSAVQDLLKESPGRTQVVLEAALQPAELLEAMKLYSVKELPDRESTLQSTGRAATIIGNIFQNLATHRKFPSQWTRWLAWGGTGLWSLVEISTPRKLTHWYARYWFALAAILSAILIAGGVIFTVPAAQNIGVKLLLLTLAIYFVTLFLAAFIDSGETTTLRKSWARYLKVYGRFVVLAALWLITFGLLALGVISALHYVGINF